jgi:O-antigen/teichoic acid export membrane protein
MGYSTNAIKGLSWMGVLRVVIRSMTVVRIAILARLLTPAQFGIFGIASLVLSFVEVFTEFGVNIFLVQLKENIKEYVSSAWIVSIFRGIVISLIILLSAPLIAYFFHSQDSVNTIRLIAIAPFIRGFINPVIIQFQKELQFNREFFLRSTLYLFEAIVAITLTFVTRSINSLAWALIASASLEVIFSFVFLKVKPELKIEGKKIKQILSCGRWITLAGIFNFLFHNGDNIVVGRMLGVQALGYYDNAYNVSMLPITEIGDVVQQVTLPVYSRIHSDRERLWNAFKKTLLGVICLTLPFGLLLIFFSNQLVNLFLGSQWLPVVPVLRVLAIFGVARAISGTPSSLFYAIGKQSYVTVITLVSFLALAISIVPLVYWFGLLGAGYSVIFATFSAIPVVIYYLVKVFKKKNGA